MITAINNTPLSEMTVSELVEAAQSGNRSAFGCLVARYQPHVIAMAMRRMKNADEAEELAQDVFLQAMEKIHQLRTPAAFGGWLSRIVHHMAINRCTRRKPVVACDPCTIDANCLESGAGPEAIACEREHADLLHRGLQRIGDIDRETLEAFYLQGLSLLEISASFDIPVGTVKRRLHDARKRLATKLEMLHAV